MKNATTENAQPAHTPDEQFTVDYQKLSQTIARDLQKVSAERDRLREERDELEKALRFCTHQLANLADAARKTVPIDSTVHACVERARVILAKVAAGRKDGAK